MRLLQSEKDSKLAQQLGQLQHFIAVFPQQCMGQPSFWANLTPFSLKAFTPVYEALAASAPNVKSYFVNIDDEDGMALARQLGAPAFSVAVLLVLEYAKRHV